MNYEKLAELLFPHIDKTPADYEAMYPARDLPAGAKVTRLGPSPTGFIHLGNLYGAFVDERLAHQSGGKFFLRIEDTDDKRYVEGAVEIIINSLRFFGIQFDEGATMNGDIGDYGDYTQSHRGPIYQCFAKKLVAEGKAYPCFMTEEDIAEIHAQQEAQKANPGIYGKWAKSRDLSMEEIEAKLAAGTPYVIRLKSDGDMSLPEDQIKRFQVEDAIRGTLDMPVNDQDTVLLKATGIPTYHFAHVVDDHLMRTTHVVRGAEWLPSLPIHVELFEKLGWEVPIYCHTAQLMKMDGGSKRKLSKRKDPELALSYYYQQGIPVPSVMEYLMTLLNSNFEEWRRANQTAPLDDFPFSTKKMSVSGSLFDMDKLHDVSKNVISRMSAEDVYDSVAKWSADNDPEFHALFVRDPEMTKQFLAIGRGGKKPRKDLALWSETKAYMDFMFDELFQPDYSGMPERAKADAKAILTEYQDVYDAQDEMTVWFDKVKALAERHGFAPETKLYKKNPEQYKGPVGDISMVLRVAICGRTNAPDLYSVMQLMPTEKIKARLAAACEAL